MGTPHGVVRLVSNAAVPGIAPTTAHLDYHGGKILGAVEVVAVFWGAFWQTADGSRRQSRSCRRGDIRFNGWSIAAVVGLLIVSAAGMESVAGDGGSKITVRCRLA